MAIVANKKHKKLLSYPFLTPADRLLIWEKARGIWKRRFQDPIQELKKIRKEWDKILSLTNK